MSTTRCDDVRADLSARIDGEATDLSPAEPGVASVGVSGHAAS